MALPKKFSSTVLCTKPKHIDFTLFTTDDIKKLAVCEIVTPLTFDVLGNPLTGGLYDPRLGPLNEKSPPCRICHQTIVLCPGHFGYIKLPVPVVNPLFHKIVFTLLKYSCMECFHIQIPAHIKHTIDVQMKLLAQGKVVEALEMQQVVTDLMGRYDTMADIPEEEMSIIKKYEDIKWLDVGSTSSDNNRNIQDLRNKVHHDIWKGIHSTKRCYNCKAPPKKLTKIKHKLILHVKQSIDKDNPKSLIRESIAKPVNPEESRKILRKIWDAEKEAMANLFPVLKTVDCAYPVDVFFMEVVPVPPSNVRPVNFVAGRMSEHAQTAVYKRILQDALLLSAVVRVAQKGNVLDGLKPETRAAYAAIRGGGAIEKLANMWDQLQMDVNGIVDNEGRGARSGEQGLKQIIEKKTGVIRQHMMGKRVNFAARSVITPDPNLSVDEIGVPEVFAMHLTYPVPVTTWNVEQMRQLITNGPMVHPGAVSVELESGTRIRINHNDPVQQEALLKRLLTPDGPNKDFRGFKTVHRHLCNGDILLLNRQPTLHRPSIMAHRARVLKDEKTLRLHYANCKAYNADFDGDEMNAHFPQNEVARSEGYHIVNVANQYLGPKDGTPLSGLIQDHMIAGVKMSIRGRFFNLMDYQQLVYQALSNNLTDIVLLPPAILKPQRLWSGKQVLSTVILNMIPKGRAPINLTAGAKIPPKAWERTAPRRWVCGVPFRDAATMSEAEVIIRGGQLLVGILDKTHYGATPYGLVHCMYELYGGTCAIKLLSAFAKLFTSFLQTEGFTLGVEDILVRGAADARRTMTIERSREIGRETMCRALNMPLDSASGEIVAELERQSAANSKLRTIIDRHYKSALDAFTNDVNKACLPAGLIAPFPANNLQLMVLSGAKGSTVNTMQISCMLGQIELEGRRPPVMISGKSLPSFALDDFSPRAGGYIDGRFMTGIQPQEFFFHCMAGREGLIDTAVKTSRSGYLQRCLIKHLEGLRVGYDLTVRDSDNCVIQFAYGEDGMDISKAQFLEEKHLRFLVENARGIVDERALRTLKADEHTDMDAHRASIERWRTANSADVFQKNCKPFTQFSQVVKHKVNISNGHKRSDKLGTTKKDTFIHELWSQAGPDIKEAFLQNRERCPEPVVSKYQPDVFFGAMNERLEQLLDRIEAPDAKDMFRLKAMQSLCQPGDPVGPLAAQSIGEPSTQMTLNTFHFAGRGEMNVTLGIPRLREILMIASKEPKTPSMEVPFKRDIADVEAQSARLLKILTRVVVADVLEKVVVTNELVPFPVRQYRYVLRFHFIPRRLYKRKYNVTPKRCLAYMQKTFFKLMFFEIKRRTKMKREMASAEDAPKKRTVRRSSEDGDEDDGRDEDADGGQLMDDDNSSDEEPEDVEDAKAMSKYTQIHDDQEDDAKDADVAGQMPQQQCEEEIVAAVQNATVGQHSMAESYTYDTQHYEWCELTFNLPLGMKQLDMTALLRDVAQKAVLWETPNIKRAITYSNKGVLTLRTDGVNFTEMFKYADILELKELYSNDIHKIAETYGIEAAARVIVKEVRDVFKVYGITVDHRHLSLIADYMTFSGAFQPLNRKGMESSASPMQQMSFESSLTFLKSAVINAKRDQLQNPSSCLMIGKPCNMGTGSFNLLQNLRVYDRVLSQKTRQGVRC